MENIDCTQQVQSVLSDKNKIVKGFRLLTIFFPYKKEIHTTIECDKVFKTFEETTESLYDMLNNLDNDLFTKDGGTHIIYVLIDYDDTIINQSFSRALSVIQVEKKPQDFESYTCKVEGCSTLTYEKRAHCLKTIKSNFNFQFKDEIKKGIIKNPQYQLRLQYNSGCSFFDKTFVFEDLNTLLTYVNEFTRYRNLYQNKNEWCLLHGFEVSVLHNNSTSRLLNVELL